MQHIHCSKCGEPKPPSAFPRNANKRHGVDTECLRCKRARENSPESRKAKRERDLQRRYGISLDEYEHMVETQRGLCAICQQPERKTNSYGEPLPLAVDHDHKTGAIRGLLCSKHNKAIGLFGDTVDALSAAVRYLRGDVCEPF